MANTLDAKTLKNVLSQMESAGTDLSKVKIVIGNDEELNGVHSSYFINFYDMGGKPTDETTAMFKLINDCDYSCADDIHQPNVKILLIS